MDKRAEKNKREKAPRAERKVNKPLYIVLSIFIACALWLYVRNVENPDTTAKVTGIPVAFMGEDVLNKNNLMITDEGKNFAVTLSVQGKWSVVSRLRRDNVVIQADLSRITEPGEYNLAYDILWPETVSASSISVLDRSPFYVTVTVERRISRPVELKGVFTGSVAEGYQAGEFSFLPEKIEISGVEGAVAQVAYAQVELKRDDLSETVREDMTYILIGQDGEPIEEGLVECAPATVQVTYPVTMVKEVPLTVDFIPGGGATAEMVEDSVTITPDHVVLAGSEDDLAAYSNINLGSIDLAKVLNTGTYTMPIPIGAEVENVSGVQEAIVQVTVSGLSTIRLDTDDIEIINVPAGVEATPVTQSLQVQVRGSEETLALVLPQYLRVVVDLKDQTLPAGQNLVTAKVILDGVTGAGVIGEYKVSISLSASIGQGG